MKWTMVVACDEWRDTGNHSYVPFVIASLRLSWLCKAKYYLVIGYLSMFGQLKNIYYAFSQLVGVIYIMLEYELTHKHPGGSECRLLVVLEKQMAIDY